MSHLAADVGVVAGSASILCVACWRLSQMIDREEEEASGGTGLLGDSTGHAEPMSTIFDVTGTLTWVLPLAASFGLLLVYYFPAIMFWFMVAAFVVCAFWSLPFVVAEVVKGRDTALYVASAVCVLVWLVTGVWYVHDLLTASVVVAGLCHVRLESLRHVALLLGLFLLYDVFWVYYSAAVFGEGVMVAVASSHAGYLKTPGAFLFPVGRGQFVILGAGDVLVPGLAVMNLLGFEKYEELPYHMTIAAVIGYCAGMTLCSYALDVTMHGQPALLFLVPCTLLPAMLVAQCKGVFSKLWNGRVYGYDPL